ncbi:MAG: lipid-A-disaccharide synthase [Synergistaceae bacterium]|nr:lipid-A-disaccharide synthase [Synergistaceae bacterium]
MSVFISSGEASGDHYTAALARRLRANGYSGDIWGMGGIESRAAPIRVEWHGERLQLLGLTEVFSAIPSIFRLRAEMVERIMELSPRAVVVCDSPDYHMRLISKLRSRGYGGRVFYISPPSVWAWRSGRADALRRDVDECLPLFKFEHDYLLSRGCASYWIGHPLLEEHGARRGVPSPLAGRYDGGRLIAFLPGSRKSEIRSLLPMMEEAAARLAAMGWQPVFSVAPGLNPAAREEMIRRFSNGGISYYDGPGSHLMAEASCAVGASGTITVESLLLGCYMVVTYRLNPLTAFVARRVIKTEYYAMANILAGCEMFPELLQERATAENLVSSALRWLEDDGGYREDTAGIMERARLTLGEEGVYDFWSRRIMEAA